MACILTEIPPAAAFSHCPLNSTCHYDTGMCLQNTDPDDEDGDDEPDFSDYDLLSARSIVKEVLAEDPSFHHLTRLTTALNRLQLQVDPCHPLCQCQTVNSFAPLARPRTRLCVVLKIACLPAARILSS